MDATDQKALEAYEKIREYCMGRVCQDCIFQAEEGSGFLCIFESRRQGFPVRWQKLEIG